MAYYALFYQVVDDFIARRAAFRDEHLRLAREARARGELVLAGPLADPPGALIIFQADSSASAEALALQDSPVQNGPVAGWKVRNWTVAFANRKAPHRF